ncbi:hypothetical protein [Heterosigma akashiwo virus 01]|uniref:Competence protein CoiA nuclease-like domain-containing protein n=1 Tax=Heterosigma akashiwo virus 01 TaxID=97195 RepID=A0A1C9C5D0_HAV01|nr:hypothetical protein D1R72_gp157 [Heterosigma akashiwo virus 01]AOM63488.1 hypothetical protein [Heterosigma akashiwo virus 01]
MEGVISGNLSQFHSKWQKIFKNDGYSIEVKYEGKISLSKNRRADIVLNDNKILEIQHSKISEQEVSERKNDYSLHDVDIIWIIDANYGVEIVEKLKYGTWFITFKDQWKHNSFKKYKYVYLDYLDKDDRNIAKIIRIEPGKIKRKMIDVFETRLQCDFISYLKENKTDDGFFSEDKRPQCTIHFRQLGAGCGKTYTSIRIIEEEQFKTKSTFVYLTKAHSAKSVIADEFKNCFEIEKFEDYICENRLHGKQLKYKLTSKSDNKRIIDVIIGTIDSFMYALGNKNAISGYDYFSALVKSVSENGVREMDNAMYAREKNILDKKTLVIVDEAQDLPSDPYLKALVKIMRDTYIDTYIIGDKLQSLYDENNIHSELGKTDTEHEHVDYPEIEIKRYENKNIVRRFHNPRFIEEINKIVNFNKYNLPEITGICDKENCEYGHDENIDPITVFLHKEKEYIEKDVNKIMEFVKQEVERNNYEPENFMFIFTYIKKNKLARILQIKLQDFWVNYLEDKGSEFKNYAVLHYSDEGKSINLDESKKASRLLSIHASKGTGREVVFFLNVDEYIIKNCYCKYRSDSLTFDSLFHVGVTRQKKKLYIGLNNDYDEIASKLNFINIENRSYLENFKNKKQTIWEINLQGDTDNEIKENLNKVFECKIKKIENDYLCDYDNPDKTIIDMGHHILRNQVLYFQLFIKIYFDTEEYSQQFCFFINSFLGNLNSNPEIFNYEDYIKELKKHDNTCYPILKYNDHSVYSKYATSVKDQINNIKRKIKENINELRNLKPIEMIIFLYCINIMHHGTKITSSTISDIYTIKMMQDNVNTYESEHKKIAESIENHYTMCRITEDIYNRIKMILSEYNIEFNKLRFNNEKHLHFKIKKIILNTVIPFIGYDENNVIIIYLYPNVSKLNISNYITNAYINEYLLRTSISIDDDKDRYQNKMIYSCIFSYKTKEPIVIKHETDENDKYDNVCRKEIENIIIKKHGMICKILFNEYAKLYNLPGNKRSDALGIIIKELCLPEYVNSIIRVMKRDIKKEEKKEKKDEPKKELDETEFINQIIDYLEEELEEDM